MEQNSTAVSLHDMIREVQIHQWQPEPEKRARRRRDLDRDRTRQERRDRNGRDRLEDGEW